jgi:hypothetical protein
MVKIMEQMNGDNGELIEEKTEHRDVINDWVEHILDFVGRDVDFSQYTIVADGGNGAA